MSLFGEAALIMASIAEKWPSTNRAQREAAVKALEKDLGRKNPKSVVEYAQLLEAKMTELYGPPRKK